jgi:hypothetical protein
MIPSVRNTITVEVPQKEGFLKKWTNIVTRWKKRYFILSNGVLEYSKTKDSKRKGTIYISTCKVQFKPKNLIIIDTGMNSIKLKTLKESDAKEWYYSFIQTKEKIGELINDTEFNRERVESAPDINEALTYTKKLWSSHKKLDEKYNMLPSSLKLQAQDFMEAACEFKNLAIDTLNVLEEDKKKDTEESEDDEFEDARSQATIFEEVKYFDLQIAYRDKLPVARNPNQKINIWKILKDTIGQDLSKMAVPVYFNEPLSFLQRFTEDLAFSQILSKASNCQDPAVRLAYIACFTVSGYANSAQRLLKPFNPVLGETFELEKDGFRVISEQVSHHPPVSAIHCDHADFSFYAHSKVSTSFKGTYLKVKPVGKFNVKLHKFDELYTWEKPYTNVNNIIVGKINVDHHGKVHLSNEKTGHSCELVLKKRGWFSKDIHQVSGYVKDSEGNVKVHVEGCWSESMKISNLDTGEELIAYSVPPPLPEYEYSYFFSEFAMQLNLPPDLLENIAPTDSRRRPDQRALENADLELAAREKQRVEEKQRTARKAREERAEEWKPTWFMLNDDGDWVYKGGFWQAKQYNNFEACPDIF